jgi:hypothetical protein
MRRIMAALVSGALAAAVLVGGGTSAAFAAPLVASAEQVMPGLVGMKLSDAVKQLKDAGAKPKAVDASKKKRVILMKSNWVVTAQSVKAGEALKDKAKVTLKALKKSEVEPKPAESPAAPTVTASGLDETVARQSCDLYGEALFPWGYKPHWIIGVLAKEIQGDAWFMKVTATVKNEYNAERDIVIECTVSGSNEAPAVTSYLPY